jgi:predicted dehydrogenase
VVVNDPIGWGIIGCGDVVERKVGPGFQECERSRLVAVMRQNADLVREYAARHRVPFWTTEAEEVIRHPEVDAIYVATPPAHHVGYALRAAAAGKPCLVEKPAGRSAAECARMVEAFEAARLPLFVSYYRRFLPKFQKVKAILDAGELGPIVAINYRLSLKQQANDWRVSPEISGGGRFFDLGGHIFDLLDEWFGPIELSGSSATNALPAHEAEDAVAVCFRAAGGAIGSAVFNFASAYGVDRLEIEGVWGRMALACLDRASPIEIEVAAEHGDRPRLSAAQRLSRKLRGKPKRPKWIKQRHEFAPIGFPLQPMIGAVVDALVEGRAGAGNGEAALRISRLLDGALADYYAGRNDPFWERPQTWHSLKLSAARSVDGGAAAGHELTAEQIRFFEENGYLGPFKCESPYWKGIAIPKNERLSLHLQDPALFHVCTHPSVVDRVAQLLGDGVSLFKSRIWVKPKRSTAVVPWHQDVGVNNGGVRDDGSPVPTVTVWLALDRATRDGGAVKVLPGSHRRFFGDWRKNIHAELETTGALDGVDLSDAVSLEADPGEFYIFHSWVLHGSGLNTSDRRRAGLNMRFAAPGDAIEPQFEYIRLRGVARTDVPDRALATAAPSAGEAYWP